MDAINISTSEGTVCEIKTAILDILDTNSSNEVLIKALDVLQHCCEVKNVTIQNCTFQEESVEEEGEEC